MSIFNEFPYTNFHELNLDWIIKEIKNLITTDETLAHDIKAIEDYLATLNVDQKIQDTIRELIDTGQMDQIVMDALDEISESIENLEETKFKYYPSYIKTLEDFVTRPVICCWNPARNAVAFVNVINEDTYVSIGDLESDNITPDPIETVLLHHPNDITYYTPTNELLIADVTNNIKIVNAQTLNYVRDLSVNWGGTEIIGVAYNPDKDTLVISGTATGDMRNIIIAELDYSTGNVENQFLIPIERFHNHAVQDSFIQGCLFINDEFTLITASINGNYTPYGFSLIGIDMLAHNINSNNYYDIEGEAETGVMINDELIIYGHSNLSNGSRYGSMAVFMSITPRGNISTDLYVDETRTTNGNGTSTEPFNSLCTAIYNVQMFNMAATIILNSDITKPLYIPQKHINNIRIAGANQTIYIVNNLTVNYGEWSFIGVTIRRSRDELLYWTFSRGSIVTFEGCTFRRDAFGYVLLVFNTSFVLISNATINVTPSDTFGICQSRYGSIVTIYCGSITMPATNPLVNAVDGTVINTGTIDPSYTNPFPTGASGLKLGK